MKTHPLFASCTVLAVLLSGCTGGASEPSAPNDAAAQNGFTRPMTDAEKAKGSDGPGGGAAMPPGSTTPK